MLARGLLLALAMAASAMGAGFWLKWRHLLQPDPHDWYLFSWGRLAYTDLVALYLQQDLASHPIPYLETWLEYPVVVGLVQYLASYAPGAEGYFLASGLVLALAGLGTVVVLYGLDPRARLWVFAATPPLALYAALNWDLLAIFFALLSLLLFQRRRDGWSAIFLTLGIWTKLFPAALIPWMLAQRAVERDWRGAGTIGALVVGVSAALNLPLYLANPEGWLYFADFHSARAPDGGSLWAALPEWSVETVNQASLAVGGLVVVGLALAATAARRGPAEFALGALAFLFLTSKVTSPQFDLWLMPFMALVPAPVWLVGLFVGVDLAYFWSSFQWLYLHWGGEPSPPDTQLALMGTVGEVRQWMLLLICLWVGWRMLAQRR